MALTGEQIRGAVTNFDRISTDSLSPKKTSGRPYLSRLNAQAILNRWGNDRQIPGVRPDETISADILTLCVLDLLRFGSKIDPLGLSQGFACRSVSTSY